MILEKTKPIRKQYYLDPFPINTDPAIATTRKKYALKSNCTVLPNPLFENGLAQVENHATLLIDGHGLETDPTTIEVAFHGTSLKRRYENLADLIANWWRLPKQHVKIRMLACWGYGFARQLAMELAGTHGYASICVAGYKYSVAVGVYDLKTGRGPNPARVPTGPGEEELSYDKSRIAWYNGQGEEVAKPDVGGQAIVGYSTSAWN